jgi:hypothetical protein
MLFDVYMLTDRLAGLSQLRPFTAVGSIHLQFGSKIRKPKM